METENINLLEIEAKLKNDEDGSYKDALLSQLDAYGVELKTAMDKGMTTEMFQKTEALKQGAEASAKVVKTVWESFHTNT